MNKHPNLETMIRKETDNPNPRGSAGTLLKAAPPDATHAVLYSDRHRQKWQVLFIPSEGLPNLAQAARSRAGGLPPVATAPIPQRPDHPRTQG